MRLLLLLLTLALPAAAAAQADTTPPTVTLRQDGFSTVAGTTEPGLPVTVTTTSSSGSRDYATTADEGGSFRVDVLASGAGQLQATAYATDAAGNRGQSETIYLSVPIVDPGPTTVDLTVPEQRLRAVLRRGTLRVGCETTPDADCTVRARTAKRAAGEVTGPGPRLALALPRPVRRAAERTGRLTLTLEATATAPMSFGGSDEETVSLKRRPRR